MKMFIKENINMNDELKAKYNRIANDPSQLEMFKNDQIDAMSTLQDAIEGKATIEAVTELIEGGTLDGKFNSISTEGFLTADAGVSTPSLTCDGSQINAQKPVVELMGGYAFSVSPTPNLTKDFKYVGAVKNGNKLTLALAVDLTRTGACGYNVILGNFKVPVSIYNKLFPSAVLLNELAAINAQIFSSATDFRSIVTTFGKSAGEFVGVTIRDAESKLLLDVKYFMRIEITFLLSDSLLA